MAGCCSGRIALRVGLAWTLLIASFGVLIPWGFHAHKCIKSFYSGPMIDCLLDQLGDQKAKYDENDCFHVVSDFYQCMLGDATHVRIMEHVRYLLMFLAAACLVSVGFMRPPQSTEGQQVVRRTACCSTWTKIVAALSFFVLGMLYPAFVRFLERSCISPDYKGCLQDEKDDNEADFEENECFEVIYETEKCVWDGIQTKNWTAAIQVLWIVAGACFVLSIVVSCTLCCCQPEQHSIAQQRRIAPEAAASTAAPPCDDVTAPLVTSNPAA